MKKMIYTVNLQGSKAYLWAELSLMFFLMPLFISLTVKVQPLLLIILGGFGAFYLLYNDKTFDKTFLYKLPPLNIEYARIGLQVILFSGLLYYFISRYFPDKLFIFLRKDFDLWLHIILVYTFLAVYPQEIIYRAFIFHRYAHLFSSNAALIHLSAISFAFGHIIYLNPVSFILALCGGYIFSFTYARTKSVFLVSIEHILYGTLLYTIGFGTYFYSGVLN